MRQLDGNGHVPALTEPQTCDHIEALCAQMGLVWHHDPDGPTRRGTPGFPDYVITGPYGVLFREVKAEGGSMDTGQRHWRDLLTAGGADWGIWRPIDVSVGRVVRELAAIAGE